MELTVDFAGVVLLIYSSASKTLKAGVDSGAVRESHPDKSYRLLMGLSDLTSFGCR